MLAYVGVMAGMLLAALDQTSVATALPRIVSDLGGFERLAWVVTAYLLASTITIPLYGKLSDLFGRKRLFTIAICVLVGGSALAGVAQNMPQLVAFRAIQGIGGGGIFALAQASIGDLFSPRERGRYQGYTGLLFALASVVGPVAGGLLADHGMWRWIFFLNLPIGAGALAVVSSTLHIPFHRREHSIDFAGAATLAAGVTSLVFLATWSGIARPWASPRVVGAAVSGVVLLCVFVVVELRAKEPIIPLELFRSSIVAHGSIASLLIGAGLFAVPIYITVFVQRVIGATATNSGIVLIPLTLGMILSSIVAGQIISRTGHYRAFPISGSIFALVGFLLLTRMDIHTSKTIATRNMVLIGLGIGQMFQTYILAVQNAVKRSELGIATATTQFFASIGATFGVAALGTVLNQRFGAELTARLGSAATDVTVSNLLRDGATSDIAPRATEAVRVSLAAGLHSVFVVALPVVAALVIPALFLKEIPLRTDAHVETLPEATAIRTP